MPAGLKTKANFLSPMSITKKFCQIQGGASFKPINPTYYIDTSPDRALKNSLNLPSTTKNFADKRSRNDNSTLTYNKNQICKTSMSQYNADGPESEFNPQNLDIQNMMTNQS